MTVHRNAAVAALVGAVPLLLTAVTTVPAQAHGAPTDPVSRVAACGPTGERTARSAACTAAVAANGGRTFDDWDNLRVADVRGKDRQVIPDGKLCSAGVDGYQGLDTARADWPATRLTAGDDFTLTYRSTIPHQGTFSLYLTKDGYDPATPLSWDDLESEPFLTARDPKLEDGSYHLKGRLPAGMTGRHVMYTVWRNTDTPDTYYSCSDVVFKGGDEGRGSGSGGGSAASEEGKAADSAGSVARSRTDGPAASPTDSEESSDAKKPTGSDDSVQSTDSTKPASAEAGSEYGSLPVIAGIAAALAAAAVGAFAVLRRRPF
ncbi:lytic polysaccharide monooxygenase auxiliary activity family 9 protein [Streptomyces sp. 8N706]|uniref:lytic polysaccharide monooxygenase auxiliary activity family 9 protein n=1 Tax=Streptomyces sp. 8N706 TaxID=3457416 RepID=UPI003FD3EAD1